MADEVRLIDANALKEDFMNDYTNYMMESLRGNHHDVIRIAEVIERIEDAPTIEVEPVNTDKCKALRNIEGIRLILSNVYNTGSTLQDCDYDAIYKRLDVIENILKGK